MSARTPSPAFRVSEMMIRAARRSSRCIILLTPLTASTEHDLLLLGGVLQAFHDNPVARCAAPMARSR